jgi:uncharacterized membrane protein
MDKDNNMLLKTFLDKGTKSRKRIFHSIKAKADSKRTKIEKLADFMTSLFGSNLFLAVNVVLFLFWVLVNTNSIKGLPAFDPFPFSLLTTFVSLEAIILAIFVLISQRRTSKVDDLREEIHLQLNFIAESEITKLIKMVSILLEKQGIDLSKDPELKKMVEPVSEEEIEKILEKEIL